MAKRRGAARKSHNHRRDYASKRSRFLERIRVYTVAKLTDAYIVDTDPTRDQHGNDEHGYQDAAGSSTTAEARAFFGCVLKRDADTDPELAVLSPVSPGTDSEQEF